MHLSSKKRFQWFISNYEEYMIEFVRRNNCDAKIKVLDIGGVDYNGTIDEFLNNKLYDKTILDIDDKMHPDIVPLDIYHWNENQDASYDLVISISTLCHIDYPWLTIQEMCRVCKSGGLVCIITPSMRYDGNYPRACWAINKDGLIALANWGNLKVLDASVAGIPDVSASEEWDYPLDDAMLIAFKEGETFPPPPRKQLGISRRYKNYPVAEDLKRKLQALEFLAKDIQNNLNRR